MRGLVIVVRWIWPLVVNIATAGAILVGLIIAGLVALMVLVLGGEAVLDWKGSALRDKLLFREEQRLEDLVNQAIKDDKRPSNQPVVLSDIIKQPMARACIEGKGAPSHVWRDGPTRKLMKQSYRPSRRPPFDDYHDTILAVAFADGRVLGILVPFDRYGVDFGTPDRFVCAEGGRIVFTVSHARAVRIRGD